MNRQHRWGLLPCMAFLIALKGMAGPVEDFRLGTNLDFDLKYATYRYEGSGFRGGGEVRDEDAPPHCLEKQSGSLNIKVKLSDFGLPTDRELLLQGSDLGGNRLQFYVDQDNLDIWIEISGFNVRIDRIQMQLRALAQTVNAFTDPLCHLPYNTQLTPIDGDSGNFLNAWGIVRIGFIDLPVEAWVRNIDYIAYGGVERIAPVIEFYQVPPLERWYNENQVVLFRITDNWAVRGYGKCWGSGGCDPGFQFQGNEGRLSLFDAPGDGKWTGCVRAWDQFDNSALACTGWLGLDRVAPDATRTGGAEPNRWYRGSVSVSWQVTDPGAPDRGSGVRGFQYKWGEGSFSEFIAGDNGQAPLEEGKKHLIVRTFDNTDNGRGDQGNSRDVDLGEYWLDNTPPTADLPQFSIPSPCNALSVQVTLSGRDTLSGVTELNLLVNGNLVGSVPGDQGVVTWNTGAFAEGTYQVQVKAKDAAGNEARTDPVLYTLDRTPPVTQATLQGNRGPSNWFSTPVQVTLTATDSSGIRETRYSLNGGAEQTYTAPFQIATEGYNTLLFYSYDATNPPPGNRESNKQVEVWIDTTPPVRPAVEDSGETTESTSFLDFQFCSGDDLSGLYAFRYWITEDPNAPDPPDRDWTVVRMPNKNCYAYRAYGLRLEVGHTYYIRVQTQNGAGLWSPSGQSDGIEVVPSSGCKLIYALWGSAGSDYPAENQRYALQGTLGDPIATSTEGNQNGRVGSLLGDPNDPYNDLYAAFWELNVPYLIEGTIQLEEFVGDITAVPLSVRVWNDQGQLRAEFNLFADSNQRFIFRTLVNPVRIAAVSVKAPNWLRKRAALLSPGDICQEVPRVNLSLVNGDADGDNRISDGDLRTVLLHFGQNTAEGDLNGDRVVNDQDLNLVLLHFGLIGEE